MKKEGIKIVVGGLTIFMGLFVSYGCGYIKGAMDLSHALDEDIKKHPRPANYSVNDICKTINDLVFDGRKEAQDVIDFLNELIQRYGEAQVADLYDIVGITTNMRDSRFGWTQLDIANVEKIKHGYKLVLSRPIKL